MKFVIVCFLGFFSVINAGYASNDRTLPWDQIHLKTLKIDGIQRWRIDKVCIDFQAYLLIYGGDSTVIPSGISPSFKNGKPEQCFPKKL